MAERPKGARSGVFHNDLSEPKNGGPIGAVLTWQKMPPPGYRSAASRSTPTQPLVAEPSPGPTSNTWVASPEQQTIGTTVSADTSGASAGDVSAATVDEEAQLPVRRRLLAEDNHSPPDGPTDSPPDGAAPGDEISASSPAAASPVAMTQTIGATDEPTEQDTEEARLEAQLVNARQAREAAQKDARKKRQIASGGTVSWVKLSRLYNSQGFFSPRRSRFVRRHPAVDAGLRLVILSALLATWIIGTIFAPGLALGVAPAGGPFPLPSSMWLIDALPLSAFRNPQVSGIAAMSVGSLLFCGLGFTLLHPRLATPVVSLFVAASIAQGLATFYDLANDPVDGVVTASIALMLLLGAVGSAASQCSTHRLRAIFGGFWKPGAQHQHHPVMPPLAALAVWLGISLGGLLGPALVSGSPRVTFDASPWLGLLVMAAGLGLLGAVAWHFFHPRLFVALVCGGVGLFGGGLIATQLGDDSTSGGRKFVGIGIAIMITCCGAAVAKGRKLCCSCGGAHNAHEGRDRNYDEGFSSAILGGGGGGGPGGRSASASSSSSSESGADRGLNTDWAGNTPSKRKGKRRSNSSGSGGGGGGGSSRTDGPGSAVARAQLEFGDDDDDGATEARQRRRRIHFADEPSPVNANSAGPAAAAASPSPARSALAVRSPAPVAIEASPAAAGASFDFSRRRGSSGGSSSASLTTDLEMQSRGSESGGGGGGPRISPNAAFAGPAAAAGGGGGNGVQLDSALTGLRRMLQERAQQLETPSPSPGNSDRLE